MKLLVFVLALMAFAGVTAATPTGKYSSPRLLTGLRPDYAKYVVCYTCGSRYNKSKSKCDDDMRRRLSRYGTYKLNARLDRIRKSLSLTYQTETWRWCGAPWVKKFL